MARIALDGIEVVVSEDLEVVLSRLVASKDGIRLGNGSIKAPPGWMVLTEAVSGEEIYVHTQRLGYVRED
jgi:hypothetical protein